MSLEPRYKFFIGTTTIAVGLSGTIVIIGWLMNVNILKGISPDYVFMKFNTACCFLLLSILSFLQLNKNQKSHYILSNFLIGVVLFCSIMTLSEGQLNVDFGIDQLFGKDYDLIASHQSFPGKMSSLKLFASSC